MASTNFVMFHGIPDVVFPQKCTCTSIMLTPAVVCFSPAARAGARVAADAAGGRTARRRRLPHLREALRLQAHHDVPRLGAQRRDVTGACVRGAN